MGKDMSAELCLKKALSSRVMLAIIILFSVNLLFSIMDACIPKDFQAVWEPLLSIGLTEVVAFFMQLSTMQVPFALLGLLVPTILCVSLWVLYFTARKKEKVNIAALQLVKITTIIQIIFLWVILACLTVVLLIVLVVAVEQDIVVAITLNLELLLLLGLLTVLLVFLFMKMKKMLNGAREVARTKLPNHTVSWFWIIFFYILGGLCIIFSVPLFFIDALIALRLWCVIPFFFLSAIGLKNYKREMDALCPRRVYRVVVPKSQIIFYDNVKN